MKIHKVILPLLLVTILVFSVLFMVPASATTYYYSSGYELYSDNGNGWVINSCSLEDSEISLPERLLEKNVTTVGGRSFENRTNLTYIFIADSFTAVGAYAFSGCSSLSEVFFGCNLTNIYAGAFRYCDSLTDIDLSETQLVSIGSAAFYDCDELEEVILPVTLQTIGSSAFDKCPKLKKVLIDRSVTSIADSAFTNSPNTVIYCYEGSYAHQYAINNSIDYVLIEEPPTEPPTEAPTEAPTAEPTEAPTELRGYILGDVDNNGEVEILDATYIQRHAAYMTLPSFVTIEHGDVDNDTETTVLDATYVMRYTVQIDTPYNIGAWINT